MNDAIKYIQMCILFTEFEVTVETGKKRLAGTDANVFITLHGKEGDSRKYHLNAHNRSNSFERAQTDKFKIRVPDIGEIRSLRFVCLLVA